MNEASYNTIISKENNEFINSIFSSGKSRSIGVCFSLAYAISNKLLLPNTSVDNLVDFYEQNNKLLIDKIIDTINCSMILDINVVCDLVFSLYNLRYDSYVGRSNVIAMVSETAVEDLFGISKYVSKDVLECIKQDPIKMTEYVNKFYKLICDFDRDTTNVGNPAPPEASNTL